MGVKERHDDLYAVTTSASIWEELMYHYIPEVGLPTVEVSIHPEDKALVERYQKLLETYRSQVKESRDKGNKTHPAIRMDRRELETFNRILFYQVDVWQWGDGDPYSRGLVRAGKNLINAIKLVR